MVQARVNVTDASFAPVTKFVVRTAQGYDPCIAVLHVLIAFIVQGCVHVCLRFAVCVGSSGVCMVAVLSVMFILVLNCEEL